MAKTIEEVFKIIRAVQSPPLARSGIDDMAYFAYWLGTVTGRLRQSQRLDNEDLVAVMKLIQPPATSAGVVRQIWPDAQYATRPLEFDDDDPNDVE